VIAMAATGIAQLEDTIVALATPAGRGALAVIRLSGPTAFAIAKKHILPWPVEARVTQLSAIHSGEEVLDQSLVTIFPAPNSFTGDDTVEISTHGGYLVPSSIVSTLIASGARQALPGEFTRRAVVNGKLDLLRAEAIGDLIDAQSRAMQRAALNQLDGGLSRRLSRLREDLIGLEALIAYDIDFPEEDDGPVSRDRVQRAITELLTSLQILLATAPTGELVRDGALVVIAGPPNAGKSSLFNALLGRSRAIVTEIPGTTRDAIEGVIDGGKYPLRLVDTAGLRETTDVIERLGIEVSERYLTGAHIVLACADNPEDLETTVAVVKTRSQGSVLPIWTKFDLVADSDQSTVPNTIRASAETGMGLPRLLGIIHETIAARYGEIAPDLPLLTSARHAYALGEALYEIEQFQRAWRDSVLPAPVASVHLRTAVGILEEMIGNVDVEDVFDRVFSTFCVGK
jgi:tRNA modification GTPase